MWKQLELNGIIGLSLILGMNLVSFYLFAVDKKRSKSKAWRIREQHLLWSAVLFGGIGALLAMKGYHHKTRRLRFNMVVRLSALATLFVMYWLLRPIFNGDWKLK